MQNRPLAFADYQRLLFLSADHCLADNIQAGGLTADIDLVAINKSFV